MRHSLIFAFAVIFAAGALLFISDNATALPQGASSLPNPSSVVKPRTVASLDPVPRNQEFEVAVVADIARGFHMNSHKPSDEYLIPTTVTPQLPAGFELKDTIYPNGRLEKFSFSPNKPLDVYTGSVTLRLRLLASPSAPLGPATIPITLRYQACNDAACLPPVKVPANLEIHVAAAGTKAQRVHPELFSAGAPDHLLLH